MSSHPILRRIFITLILIIVFSFFYIYSSAFMPILLAFLTALVLNPLVRLTQQHLRIKHRLAAVILIFTLFVTSIGITTYITITRIINQVIKWFQQLPRYVVEIQLFVDNLIADIHILIEDIPQNHLIILELEKQSQLMTDKAFDAAQNVIPVITSWVQAIPNTIIVAIVYLITLFLFMLDLPSLSQRFYFFFKQETANKIRFVFQRLGKVFAGYWKAQLLLSILILILSYIGLLFIAPEHALIMSVFIWIIDIIPLYVGPALILVPWAAYAFIVGNSAMGTQLILFAFALLVIRRILEPKVMGDQMGLPALPTVLSMFFGLYFFGVMGLILGPFVVIAVKTAMEADLFNLKGRS